MLRNGPDGYGWLTKALHWVTVAVVAAQFAGRLWLHVGAHVVFFAALAAHLTTNLRPAILRRMV